MTPGMQCKYVFVKYAFFQGHSLSNGTLCSILSLLPSHALLGVCPLACCEEVYGNNKSLYS